MINCGCSTVAQRRRGGLHGTHQQLRRIWHYRNTTTRRSTPYRCPTPREVWQHCVSLSTDVQHTERYGNTAFHWVPMSDTQRGMATLRSTQYRCATHREVWHHCAPLSTDVRHTERYGNTALPTVPMSDTQRGMATLRSTQWGHLLIIQLRDDTLSGMATLITACATEGWHLERHGNTPSLPIQTINDRKFTKCTPKL